MSIPRSISWGNTMSLASTSAFARGNLVMSTTAATVFIVDDDVSVRESLELLIRNENWAPETFSSAQEFLSHPRRLAPSCLILDLSLPGLNGLELQKELAVQHIDMPIIFITGQRDETIRARVLKQRVAGFLLKPFNDTDLLAAIKTALQGI